MIDARIRGDIGHIGHPFVVQATQQPGLFAVMGIHPHKIKGQVVGPRRLDHLPAQLGFGAIHLRLRGNAGLGAARRIVDPALGQKQTPINQGGFLVRTIGQIDAHLAVIDFAQRPTILAAHSHRGPTLLREATFIQDQGRGRRLNRGRQQPCGLLANRFQQRSILPGRRRNKVRQGLVIPETVRLRSAL